MKTTVLLGIILLLSKILIAEEAISISDVEDKYTNKSKIEATKELKQSFNFGLSGTSGNTDTLNMNAKYNLSVITDGYDNNPLKIAFDTGALFSENNSTKNNEEYTANLELQQDITNGWLGYTELHWLNNPEFKLLDSKSSMGVGIGKTLYKDDTQSLLVKLGTSINSQNYSTDQETDTFGALNEYMEYHNDLNKISKFYLKVGSMQNFDDMQNDYEVLGVAGITFNVAENINLSLEGEVLYDNTPAEGATNTTDTKTVMLLGYNF